MRALKRLGGEVIGFLPSRFNRATVRLTGLSWSGLLPGDTHRTARASGDARLAVVLPRG